MPINHKATLGCQPRLQVGCNLNQKTETKQRVSARYCLCPRKEINPASKTNGDLAAGSITENQQNHRDVIKSGTRGGKPDPRFGGK